MIPNEEKKRQALPCGKKLSSLLKGITSKHDSDFYCLNCLHFFRRENQLTSHKKVCENKDFCGIVMQSAKDELLKFIQYMKCRTLFTLTLNL